MKSMRKELICTTCGYQGFPRKATKGSFLIEIVLWLAFLIPGLIYSCWRLSTRHKACSSCGSSDVIPFDSPRGRQLIEEFKLKDSMVSIQAKEGATNVYASSIQPLKEKVQEKRVTRGIAALVTIAAFLFLIGLCAGPSKQTEKTAKSTYLPPTVLVIPVGTSQLRARIEREIASELSISSRQYRIENLECKDKSVKLFLDLQFVPQSKEFLEKDGSQWADMLWYGSLDDGRVVANSGLDAFVSLWTSFNDGTGILYGHYYIHNGETYGLTGNPRGWLPKLTDEQFAKLLH